MSSCYQQEDFLVMGNFNSRLEKRNNENKDFIGPIRETASERNENGNRLKDPCSQNNMYVTNTVFFSTGNYKSEHGTNGGTEIAKGRQTLF